MASEKQIDFVMKLHADAVAAGGEGIPIGLDLLHLPTGEVESLIEELRSQIPPSPAQVKWMHREGITATSRYQASVLLSQIKDGMNTPELAAARAARQAEAVNSAETFKAIQERNVRANLIKELRYWARWEVPKLHESFEEGIRVSGVEKVRKGLVKHFGESDPVVIAFDSYAGALASS